jgi:hypothetical protein
LNIRTTVIAVFDWKDAFRILFRRRLTIEVNVEVSQPITVLKSESNLVVPPLFNRKPRANKFDTVGPSAAIEREEIVNNQVDS